MKLRLPFVIISRQALIERDHAHISEGYRAGFEAAEDVASARKRPKPISPKPKKARP